MITDNFFPHGLSKRPYNTNDNNKTAVIEKYNIEPFEVTLSEWSYIRLVIQEYNNRKKMSKFNNWSILSDAWNIYLPGSSWEF